MSRYDTSGLLSDVDAEAKRQGVDPTVARGLLLSENSGFGKDGVLRTNPSIDTGTTSPMSAYGIMQVMPSTAASLQAKGFLDKNIDLNTKEGQLAAGVATIKELNSRGISAPMEVAAAYNGGNTQLNALRAGKPLVPETADYLQKFSLHTGTPMPDIASPDVTPAMPATQLSTTVREGDTTHQRVFPPGTLQDLKDSTAASGQLSQQIQAQLKLMMPVVSSETAAGAAAATAAGAGKGQAAIAQGNIDIATNKVGGLSLSAFGTNLNDSENQIQNHMNTVNALMPQREALNAKIQAMEASRNFMQDPVGWLTTGVAMMPLIKQHNALANQEGVALQSIDELQDRARTQVAIQQPLLTDAITQRAAGQAAAMIAEGNERAANLGINGATTLARLNLELGMQDGNTLQKKFELANLTSTTVGTTSTTSQRETDRTAKDLEDLAGVNAILRAAGATHLFTSMKEFNEKPKEVRDNLLQMGMFADGKDGANKAIAAGVGPGTTVSTLYSALGPAWLGKMQETSPVQSKFVSDMIKNGQDSVTALEAQAGTPGPNSLKALQALKRDPTPTGMLKTGIDEWAKRMVDETKTGDYSKLSDGNPYKLNLTMAANATVNKDNPYAEFIRTPPGGIQINDNMVMHKAVADVTTGAVPSDVAAKNIVDLYRQGRVEQNQQTNMTRYGFPEQNGNKYPIVVKAGLFDSRLVDMTNVQSVQNYLITQAAGERIKNAPPTGIGRLPL